MLTMLEKTKENIEKIVGVSTKKVSDTDVAVFDKYIEKKIGKPLRVETIPNPYLSGRGSVLISAGRLSYIEDIDKKLDNI